MEYMRTQGGIQMLLSAEQEAQQIVANARNAKMGRLKQAKDEANRETAAFRAQLEAEHQSKISENTGSSSFNVQRLEEETEAKIHDLKGDFDSVSRDVMEMLMKNVLTVFVNKH